MSRGGTWRARRRAGATAVMLAALLAPGLHQGAQAAGRRAYIVLLTEGAGSPEVVAPEQVRSVGGALDDVFGKVRGYSARMTPTAAKKLARQPGVAVVARDGKARVFGEQSTTSSLRPAIWGLDRVDEHERKLDTRYRWAYTGQGVKVYVIDTGVSATHTEFGGRVATGFDVFGQGQQRQDCHGHGTHVAGTIGGVTYGVAKDVTIVPVRAIGCTGSAAWSDIIKGIDWVTAQAASGGPSVANMSIGGGANTAVDEAVRRSVKAGVTYTIAAGNGNILGSGVDACNTSPARVAEAVTTGATDSTDKKAAFSNYGKCVDLFAPGVGIVSAAPRATSTGPTDNNAWASMSGTSMAAPHAAGVAALFLEAEKSAVPDVVPTPAQVARAVAGMATPGVVTSSKTTDPKLLYAVPAALSASDVTRLMGPATADPAPTPPPSGCFLFC